MALIISILLFFMAAPSAGMRCIIPGTPKEELGKATAVFAGKVTGHKYVKDDLSGQGVSGKRLAFELTVERVWKGKIEGEVLMYTSEVRQSNGETSGMSEDFNFEDGKRYLIYAVGTIGRLRTSACNRSRELEKAENDLKELGAGHEPERK